jgi:hypothetical protein
MEHLKTVASEAAKNTEHQYQVASVPDDVKKEYSSALVSAFQEALLDDIRSEAGKDAANAAKTYIDAYKGLQEVEIDGKKLTEREIQELIYQQTILASEKGGKSK